MNHYSPWRAEPREKADAVCPFQGRIGSDSNRHSRGEMLRMMALGAEEEI